MIADVSAVIAELAIQAAVLVLVAKTKANRATTAVQKEAAVRPNLRKRATVIVVASAVILAHATLAVAPVTAANNRMIFEL